MPFFTSLAFSGLRKGFGLPSAQTTSARGVAVGFSDGVGWCRMLSGWCRAWRCRVGVKGCRGCQSVRMRVRLQGLSVLSGVVSDCRVVEFRVLSGVVSDCRGCVGESSLTLWCQACTKV